MLLKIRSVYAAQTNKIKTGKSQTNFYQSPSAKRVNLTILFIIPKIIKKDFEK